ncbi:MAG: hypothetical protein H8D46_00960 [FCB group bacterium]|nr:hypothetical protein [FCB group bacterium]
MKNKTLFAAMFFILTAGDTEVKLDSNGDSSGFKVTDNLSTTLFRVNGSGVVELPVSASAPGSPSAGDIYQDGTDIFYYNGSGWDDLTEGSGGPAHVYGEMTGITGTPSVTTTFTGWSLASAGDLSGVSYVNDDTNGDYLDVGNNSGTYLVSVSMAFSGSNNVVLTGSIFVNSTEETSISFVRSLGANNDNGSASASGIITVSANDQIRLKFKAGGNTTVTVKVINVSIVKIA